METETIEFLSLFIPMFIVFIALGIYVVKETKYANDIIKKCKKLQNLKGDNNESER